MISKLDTDLLRSFLKVKNKIIFDESTIVTPNDYVLFLTVLEKGFDNDLGEKSITSSGLAYYLGKSKPALTKQTKKLVKKGFLRKEKTGIDKRNRYIVLTNDALNLIYNNKTIGIVSQIREKLGEKDTLELTRLLKEIDQALIDPTTKNGDLDED